MPPSAQGMMPTSTSGCAAACSLAKLSARHVPEKGLSGLTGRNIPSQRPFRITFNLPLQVSRGSASLKNPLPAALDCPISKNECIMIVSFQYFVSVESQALAYPCGIHEKRAFYTALQAQLLQLYPHSFRINYTIKNISSQHEVKIMLMKVNENKGLSQKL